jgi:hypothetical protein
MSRNKALIKKVRNMYFEFNYGDFKKIYIFPIGYNLPEFYALKDVPLNWSMKKSKIRFFRHRTPTYPNFFHSINLPVDKVYNARNNFCLAIPYRKIGRKIGSKKVIFWKKIFLGKTQKHMVFIFDKVKLGVGVYFSGAL